MIALIIATTFILFLLTFSLIVYTFKEKEPPALVLALFFLWFIYISFNAVLYVQLAPMKNECEKQLTRVEKCVFVAVPESSLEYSSES